MGLVTLHGELRGELGGDVHAGLALAAVEQMLQRGSLCALRVTSSQGLFELLRVAEQYNACLAW
jgi:hypothetical protein